ncbi:MAG: S41 family peptidase [Vicinamibacterales bacterium]
MRRFGVAVLLLTLSTTTPYAQQALTREQRISDLTQLASQYAKNYGPYEWKRDVQGFDLLRLTPWLQRIQHSDDLDFQEALIEYVASLNDAHDLIAFPTTFSASLPMSLDIYDGNVLIDAINRTALPLAQFPFGVGDEVVSIDGRPVQELIQSFRKYAISANQRSTDRIAAARLVSRSQQIMPHVYQLGDTAAVAIKMASTGATAVYTINWLKNGIPVTAQGPLPSPVRGNGRIFLSTDGQDITAGLPGSAAATASVFKMADATPVDNTLPDYMDPLRPLLNASVSKDYYSVLNFGSRFPIFAPPPGFTDLSAPCPTCINRPGEPIFYLVGTFTTLGGVRVGFLRIPSMSPPSTAIALAQLDRAVAFFTPNTDALIVDVMRNPGGLVSFVEAVSQRLIPTPFKTIGFEIRATAAWLFSFASSLNNARLNPATPPAVLANLEANFNEVFGAFNENRGRSAPVSLNSTGSLQLNPVAGAYAKPLMVLTDEFSASGGDMLPAILQSNNRGPVFGWRTMGAGGSVVGFTGPAFTESFFRITVSLMNRGHVVNTPDFPPAPYIENIGVRPDIPVDYMTRQNLMTGGAPFVQAIIQAVENLVLTAPH